MSFLACYRVQLEDRTFSSPFQWSSAWTICIPAGPCASRDVLLVSYRAIVHAVPVLATIRDHLVLVVCMVDVGDRHAAVIRLDFGSCACDHIL